MLRLRNCNFFALFLFSLYLKETEQQQAVKLYEKQLKDIFLQ